LRHGYKTRWDTDRRTGYLEFLEVCGTLQSRLMEFADVIDQWRSGEVDNEAIVEAYGDHIDERRRLADRLGVVQTQFMLYAPVDVLQAAGGVVSELRSLLSLQDEAVERLDTADLTQDAEDRIAVAIDRLVRAFRADLRIPIPS
jgi:hypothetical protein